VPHQGGSLSRDREGWIKPADGVLIHASAAPDAGVSPRSPDRGLSDIAAGIDEAAVLLRAVAPARTALTMLGGLAACLMLSWAVCVGWVAGGLALELWSWFATRERGARATVAWRARANLAANYAAMNLWWLVLVALLWRTGTPAGMASGAVLFLTLASVVTLLFHTAPVVFLAAGAAPAIGALSVLSLAADATGASSCPSGSCWACLEPSTSAAPWAPRRSSNSSAG
jgi:hypothetical protein